MVRLRLLFVVVKVERPGRCLCCGKILLFAGKLKSEIYAEGNILEILGCNRNDTTMDESGSE